MEDSLARVMEITAHPKSGRWPYEEEEKKNLKMGSIMWKSRG
jgi:hypothetical protein